MVHYRRNFDVRERIEADRRTAEIVVGASGRKVELDRRRGGRIVEGIVSASAIEQMISGPAKKDVVRAAALENLDVGEVIDPDHWPAEIVVGIAGRQIELHEGRGTGII